MITELLKKSLDDIDILLADTDMRPHLGASIAGHPCDRKLWLEFRLAKKKVFTPRQLRIFAKGKEIEKIIIDKLNLSNTVEVVSTQEKFSEGHIAGSCDVVIKIGEEYYILEIKSANEKSFNEIVKKKCREAKPEHFVQIQLYMHYSGIKKAIYLVECKNTQEYHVEEIIYDEGLALAQIEKLKRIVNMAEPPEKLSDNPCHFICKMCDYFRICHDHGSVYNNCRTCKNVKINNSEPVYCEEYKKVIPFEFQTKDKFMGNECSKYECLGSLIPFDASLENIEQMVKNSFGKATKLIGVNDDQVE